MFCNYCKNEMILTTETVDSFLNKYERYECSCGNIQWEGDGIPRDEWTWGLSERECVICKRRLDPSKFFNKSQIWCKSCEFFTYPQLHEYIRKFKPLPTECQICNKIKNSLSCCSIEHKYTRNPSDWVYLCSSCHKKYDSKKIFI